jgi:hypothetical protein
MLSLTLTEERDAAAAAHRGALEETARCRPRSGTRFYCSPRNS